MKRESWRYLLVSAACMIAAVIIFTVNKFPRCEKGLFCIPMGKPWSLSYGGLDKSVNGLAKLNKVQAVLILNEEGTIYPLKASVFKSDEWGKEISVLGLGVKGVSVTSITKDFEVHSEINVPTDERIVGKKGKIRYLFDVTYPVLNQGDNFIERSIADSKLGKLGDYFTWSEHRKLFKAEVDVKVVRNPVSKFKIPWFVFWISLVIGIFFGLATIGSNIEDNKKE